MLSVIINRTFSESVVPHPTTGSCYLATSHCPRSTTSEDCSVDEERLQEDGG